MSKSKAPQFPAYLGNVTAEQVEAAKEAYEAARKNPLFHVNANHRRASLQAKMNSGMVIPLDLYCEFGDTIPETYRPPVVIQTQPSPSAHQQPDPLQGERKAEAHVRQFDIGAMATFMHSSPYNISAFGLDD